MKKTMILFFSLFSTLLFASDFSSCLIRTYSAEGSEKNNQVQDCFNKNDPDSLKECMEGATSFEGVDNIDKQLLLCSKQFKIENLKSCLMLSSRLYDFEKSKNETKSCYDKFKLESLDECSDSLSSFFLSEQKENAFLNCLKSNLNLINKDFCDKNLENDKLKNISELALSCAPLYYQEGFTSCLQKAQSLKNNSFHDIMVMECLEKEKMSFDSCMGHIKTLKNGMFKFGAMNICLNKNPSNNKALIPFKKEEEVKRYEEDEAFIKLKEQEEELERMEKELENESSLAL